MPNKNKKNSSLHSSLSNEDFSKMIQERRSKRETQHKHDKIRLEDKKKDSLKKNRDELENMFRNKNVDMKTKAKKLL